jgi:hypothetical protein
MGLIDPRGGAAEEPLPLTNSKRGRPPRFPAEFETDISQHYVRVMDEPVPVRFLGILRSGRAAPKT